MGVSQESDRPIIQCEEPPAVMISRGAVLPSRATARQFSSVMFKRPPSPHPLGGCTRQRRQDQAGDHDTFAHGFHAANDEMSRIAGRIGDREIREFWRKLARLITLFDECSPEHFS
jgi:hypothetical protein